MRPFWAWLLILALTGCLGSNLRSDLDDQHLDEEESVTTAGGVWPEGTMLGSGERGSVGHTDRSPAMAMRESARSTSDWVSERDRGNNTRDFYRKHLRDEEAALQRGYASLPPGALYKSRVKKNDLVDNDPVSGSLWAGDGQSNFYFSRNKIRNMGDLISISVEDDLARDVRLNVLRNLNDDELDREESIAKSKLTGAATKAGAGGAAAGAAAGAATGAAKEAFMGLTEKDLDGALGLKTGDKIMAEVIERYPNGNYKVRGVKRTSLRGQEKLVNFIAIAKGSEIGDDDSIASSKLYEYRLDVK